jgi:[acyl-carrier-protein] S-malonyltransferase
MLKLTVNSQPAILTLSIAAYEAYKSIAADKAEAAGYMAGLSLGEYSALIAAGGLAFEDGLRLVRRRAEIMDEASRRHPGKMAAVLDLAPEKIKDICLKTGAEIANLNAPGQVVISGKQEAVAQASELCAQAGAKRVIELEVSGGFHSSLMFEASAELKEFLKNIPLSGPQVPVISNYTAKPQYKAADIEENLIYQMYKAVRWEESMKFLLSQGITKFIEFGPGKVLKGLMRRIEPAAQVFSVEKKEDLSSIISN